MTATGGGKKKRIGILISGRGSNMKAIVEATRAPHFPAEVVLVVSNVPDAEGLGWADSQGVPTAALDHRSYGTRAEFDDELHTLLTNSNVDLVVCAGFMRLLTPDFVGRWTNRIINIHPSLLPTFKGLNTHERALEAGVKVSGCSVHAVRAELDDGPILGQAAVPVLQNDTPETLAQRVLSAEHKLYSKVLDLLCSEKIEIRGDKVIIINEFNQDNVLYSPDLSMM